MAEFVIDVADLLEVSGARGQASFHAHVEGLAAGLVRVDEAEALRVELLVEPVEEGILARGTISGRYVLTCRRCLAEAPAPFTVEVAEVFRPRGDVWEEGYVIDEEGRIDLLPAVRDNVMLAMPVDPLCTLECRGLCSGCGANLNQGSCSCPAEEPDDRWAALRSLLDR